MNAESIGATRELRLVSFLPSATEIACALGLTKQLVGISHACDFPPEVRGKPVVVHSAIPVDTMDLAEVDTAVGEHLRQGKSLYEVDQRLLRELAPTHILTQDLCQVCAPANNEVARALKALPITPQVLWMSPHSIADIHQDIRNLGQATARLDEAERLIAQGSARLRAVAEKTSQTSRRLRVFCAEWIDPVYCSGHWVPEMVELAGGIDVLGRKWADSVRVAWEEIVAAAPEIVVVMPCGFCLGGSALQAARLLEHPAAYLPAIQHGLVYAVDGAYFNRPSPRVVEGTELLAHLLHPDLCEWNGPSDAFCHVAPAAGNSPRQSAKCLHARHR